MVFFSLRGSEANVRSRISESGIAKHNEEVAILYVKDEKMVQHWEHWVAVADALTLRQQVGAIRDFSVARIMQTMCLG